tara:strand:+ start:2000 stop:2608 length:609 start_codon:yes stop_codon:yes gene_type:complete
MLALSVLLTLLLLCSAAAGLEIALLPSEERCVEDVMAPSVDVRATFKLLTAGPIEVTLRDSERVTHYTGTLLERGNDDSVAYTTNPAVETTSTLCFAHRGTSTERVSFTFASGVEATNYAAVKEREHLKPLELELRRLDDALKAVHSEMLFQRGRELEMRAANEAINVTAKRFSTFSMGVLLTVAIWQVFHFRGFLKKKKYI